MRRILPLFLVVAACSAAAVQEPAPTTSGGVSPTATEAVPGTTGGESPQPGEGVTETTEPTSDRPVAPDFNLRLADGSTYTLSEGSKPVFMVFWAEW